MLRSALCVLALLACLLALPVQARQPAAADAAGGLELAGCSGLVASFQYGIADVAGPMGVALSNAVRMDVP